MDWPAAHRLPFSNARLQKSVPPIQMLRGFLIPKHGVPTITMEQKVKGFTSNVVPA
jgi:hypothetical protein